MTRAIVLLLVLAVPSCGGCGRGRPLAVVGGTEIGAEDLALAQSRASARKGESAGAALEGLIERELLAEGARRDGLFDEPEVRAQVRAATREVLAQAMLERRLAAATSEAVLQARSAASAGRLSKRRVHVRQIAIRGDRAEARSRAGVLLARVRGGEVFAKLATMESDDKTSARAGGDLGPILEGQVDAAFFDAAVALRAGEVGGPVETPYGLFLVQAIDAPDSVVPPFSDVKGRLAAEARAEAKKALLTELGGRIAVKRHAPPGVGP
jgi:parvulin-like peptidyl-prolyl isomerase